MRIHEVGMDVSTVIQISVIDHICKYYGCYRLIAANIYIYVNENEEMMRWWFWTSFMNFWLFIFVYWCANSKLRLDTNSSQHGPNLLQNSALRSIKRKVDVCSKNPSWDKLSLLKNPVCTQYYDVSMYVRSVLVFYTSSTKACIAAFIFRTPASLAQTGCFFISALLSSRSASICLINVLLRRCAILAPAFVLEFLCISSAASSFASSSEYDFEFERIRRSAAFTSDVTASTSTLADSNFSRSSSLRVAATFWIRRASASASSSSKSCPSDLQPPQRFAAFGGKERFAARTCNVLLLVFFPLFFSTTLTG